jgi:hypothetical protein
MQYTLTKRNKTKLRESYGLLLLFFFLLFSTITNGQKTAWFAPQNSSGSVQVDALTNDSQRNVYTLGKFTGHFNLNSAIGQPETINAYASSSMPRVFLSKHDPNGKLCFLVEIDSRYGNAQLPYGKDVRELNNGSIAVLLRMAGDYAIIDARSDTTTIRRPKPCSLLLFSKEGIFQKSYDLPVDHASEIIETPNGDLYFLGIESSYVYGNTQKICKIDRFTDIPERIALKLPNVRQLYFYGGQLWAVSFEQIETKRYLSAGVFSVGTISFQDNSISPRFKKEIGPCRSSSGKLIESGGQLKFMLHIKSSQASPVAINGQELVGSKEGGIIIFNQFGVLEQARSFSPYHLNIDLKGSADGGYLMQATVFDTLTWHGAEPILVPKHRPYIGELIFLKLNFDLSVDWYFMGGGSNPSSTSPPSIYTENSIYMASQLIDFGMFDFGKYTSAWKSMVYIRKVDLQ